MTFGTEWNEMMDGTVRKSDCFSIFDYFVSVDGNFIDPANFYQNGFSEEW